MKGHSSHQAQASGAAASSSTGPLIAPGKGPTDRRDVIVAVAALVAVAAVIVVLVLS